MDIRERVIAACRELARSRGFYHMSMDELSARAGISKRTLYRYFSSKEEVLETVLDRLMNNMAAEFELARTEETDPMRLVERMLYALYTHAGFILHDQGLQDMRNHYPGLWEKLDEFRLEKAGTLVQQMLQGRDRDADVDPRIYTAVVLAAIQRVLNPDFILENGFTFQEAAGQLGRLMVRLLS